MCSEPCRVHRWGHRNRYNDSNPHSPSHTAQQPIKAAQPRPSPLMGWGALLHIQLNPKKFRAPSARTIIATLDLDLSPRYARQEPTGSLRSPKSVRYAHTTKPHHLATLGHTSSLRSHIAPGSPYRRRPSHTQTLHVGSPASPLLDSNQAAHADHIPTFQTHTPYFWCARPSLRSAHTSSVSHSLRSRSRHKHNRGSALSPPRGVYTLACLYGVTLLCIGWFGFLCGLAGCFCVNNPMRSEGR